MSETFLDGRVVLHCGDSMEILKSQPDCSIDSFVTDPPYALVSIVKRFGSTNAAAVVVPEGGTGAYARSSADFMGQKWDNGDTAHNSAFWAEVFRVLKPGGFVLASSGTRTYHRLACAIEDGGFEIRDMVAWLYGSGFPKSHNVGKGIDRMLGAEREVISEGAPVKRMIPGANQNKSGWEKSNGREFVPTVTAAGSAEAATWDGWGTALKPAIEPIAMARKPLIGTVAQNVLQHGTGAINIDGCRVAAGDGDYDHPGNSGIEDKRNVYGDFANGNQSKPHNSGRWPANIIHDGSEEVLAAFLDRDGAASNGRKGSDSILKDGLGAMAQVPGYGDEGSAARFFYTAKADSDDRLGSKHPTVKPVDLMQWLVRLVTPKGGLVLDPFAGTGTTAEACYREGMRCILIEREEAYHADIRRRISLVLSGPEERRRESIKAKMKDTPADHGPLFAEAKVPMSAGGQK